MSTAAAIIIGNEILTGKFADENGPFLVKRLRELGVDLVRIATIPDVREVIADEVRRASEACDVVFTSGGVGPTHDDMTLESIAMAFGVDTWRHPDLVALLEAVGLTNEPALQMATVPEGTELIFEGAASFPVMRVRNVYVLPGVPSLFRLKFEQVAHRLAGQAVHCERLYCTERETLIAERLSAAQDRNPDVDIGSYPRFGEGPYKVIVTLESRDTRALDRAVAELSEVLALLPHGAPADEPQKV